MTDETKHLSVKDKSPCTSFQVAKFINDQSISDDTTVTKGSNLLSQRMSIMVLIPTANKGIDEDEAPLLYGWK